MWMKSIALASLILVLSACGGSSGGGGSSAPTYSGSTAAADITSSNAEDIGTAAGEAAVEAINTDIASDANPFAVVITDGNGMITDALTALAQDLAASEPASSLPSGVTLTSLDLGPEFCGGSVTVPDSFGQSSTLNGLITLNALCFNDPIDGQVTLSGSITFTEAANSFSISFSNLSVTTSDGTTTLNATLECTSGFLSCTYSTDFVAASGLTHRITDSSVSGNSSSGYTVSATFSHATYGVITITTTTPLVIGPTCAPLPDSGSIAFSSTNGGSGTITFNSNCTVSGTWDDGVTSGSF